MKKLLYIVIALIVLNGCSTQSNNFMNRSYHNVTTKYNILYNGKVKLNKGINELSEDYTDNFWELLPIEPLTIVEDKIEYKGAKDDSNASKGPLDIAEEKSVKAVQKHSMNIAGKEKNKQMDEAYLLLGQSRYYSQRFVPALEAFNYSIKYNPKGNSTNQLRIWKAKTLLRLQNEENALKELKFVEKLSNLNVEEQNKLNETFAMTYLALDSILQAKKHLLLTTKSKSYAEQKTRNWFILGQLYKNENLLDSATWAFNKIIENKKSPNKYSTHAYFQLIEITKDSLLLLNYRDQLKKIINNPLNSPFKDEAYFYLAEIFFKQNRDSLAIQNLKNSIHTPNAKKFQKVLSYEKLGDYYFNKNDFVNAAQYYDSIRPFVENANTKHIKNIEKKLSNLEDVVFFENQIKHNDSILTLVDMNDNEKVAYFQKIINQLKEKDRKEKIKLENSQNAQQGANTGYNFSNSSKTNWYFYNSQTVQYGKLEFYNIWGKIELKDNWRWAHRVSNGEYSVDNTTKLSSDSIKSKNVNPRYSLENYLASIPTKTEEIQKLKNQKSEALYQLGLIYKEKFQAYPLAKDRLELFLKNEPKDNLVLPAKFHLQKIYENLNNSRSDELKSEITRDYPESRYTAMLLNKKIIKPDSVQTPEMHYEKVYCDYEYEHYNEVLKQCEDAIIQYADEPIQPKFELLKSFASYHVSGKDKFLENLKYVVANFPKTEEALHAQDIIDRMNGVINNNLNSSINEKEVKQEQQHSIDKDKDKIQPLNEEEKKQRVLQLMKEKGVPNMDDKKDKE